MALRICRITLIMFLIILALPAHANDEDGLSVGLEATPDSNSLTITGSQSLSSVNGAGESFSEVLPPTGDQSAVSHRVNKKALHWCLDRLRLHVSSHVCLNRFATNDDESTTDEETPIPDETLMHMAIAHAHIDGAGIIITPGRDWVYATLPVLARASTQSIDTQVQLLGYTIPVRFDATEFVFDFHNGSPPTRTTTPGKPYPDMTIQGTYYQPDTTQHVTLTVTWKATVTHPTTGKTLTLNAALKTRENSREFTVEKPRIRLVAP